MTTENLLPLFPLEVVIFPGTKIPLHIFEQRYRLMIGEAISGYSAFGLILVRDQQIAPEGCSAVVERVTKKHEDGRLDIDARGRKRFKTLELDDSLPYLQARVEYFEDHARPPVNKTVLAKVQQQADRLAALLGVSGRDAIDPTLSEPSFHIAHGLPLELDFKQGLLTKRSEAERLTDLAGVSSPADRARPNCRADEKVGRQQRQGTDGIAEPGTQVTGQSERASTGLLSLDPTA